MTHAACAKHPPGQTGNSVAVLLQIHHVSYNIFLNPENIDQRYGTALC